MVGEVFDGHLALDGLADIVKRLVQFHANDAGKFAVDAEGAEFLRGERLPRGLFLHVHRHRIEARRGVGGNGPRGLETRACGPGLAFSVHFDTRDSCGADVLDVREDHGRRRARFRAFDPGVKSRDAPGVVTDI